MSWPTVALGSVADVERDGVDPTFLQAKTYYVGLENISSDGDLNGINSADTGELKSTKFRFSDKHVLFGKLRPYLRKVARPTFPGICSTDIIPIAPGPRLDRAYLYHFLRTDAVINLATSMSSGANLPRISPRHLVEFNIPLPPLDEQRRIAAILDQADALRRKRRETLGRIAAIERSLFFERFGAPESNPNGFPVVDLGSLILEGPTNGLYKPASDYGSGTPILRIGDFYNGRVVDLLGLRRLRASGKEISAYELKPYDIVINRVNSRECLGKSALIPTLPEQIVFESNMMRLRLDRTAVDPTFCISFLQLRFVKQQIRHKTKDAINQSSINQKDVSSLKIMLPGLKEQEAFSSSISAISTQELSGRSHLAHLDVLFASLQHRAFRGEL